MFQYAHCVHAYDIHTAHINFATLTHKHTHTHGQRQFYLCKLLSLGILRFCIVSSYVVASSWVRVDGFSTVENFVFKRAYNENSKCHLNAGIYYSASTWIVICNTKEYMKMPFKILARLPTAQTWLIIHACILGITLHCIGVHRLKLELNGVNPLAVAVYNLVAFRLKRKPPNIRKFPALQLDDFRCSPNSRRRRRIWTMMHRRLEQLLLRNHPHHRLMPSRTITSHVVDPPADDPIVHRRQMVHAPYRHPLRPPPPLPRPSSQRPRRHHQRPPRCRCRP